MVIFNVNVCSYCCVHSVCFGECWENCIKICETNKHKKFQFYMFCNSSLKIEDKQTLNCKGSNPLAAFACLKTGELNHWPMNDAFARVAHCTMIQICNENDELNEWLLNEQQIVTAILFCQQIEI